MSRRKVQLFEMMEVAISLLQSIRQLCLFSANSLKLSIDDSAKGRGGSWGIWEGEEGGLVTGLSTARMTDLLPVPLGEGNNLTSELYSEQLSFWSARFMAFDCICAVPVLSQEWHEMWWSCQCAWGNHCFFFQILAMENSFKVCMELSLIMCFGDLSPHLSVPDPSTSAHFE